MAITVAIRHKTSYKYDRHITLSPHVIRLRPAPHTRTPISAYSLKITPENHFLNWQQDPYGNYVARLVFPEKTNELTVDVEVIAKMVVINPFDFFVESYAEKFPFEYEESLKKELLPYLEKTEAGSLFSSWMKSVPQEEMNIIDFLVLLNRKVNDKVKYTIRLEPGVQTSEETLKKELGSCRDSAWLLVQMLRELGLAARFVSGYLVQLAPDLKPLEGPTGPEKDFTDLHAWAEVYLPGAGWVGLDPTSGLFAGEGHIPLACTPTPSSAAAISGMAEKADTEFFYENNVFRIHENPRVTRPYSQDQWAAMNALGQKIDEDLFTFDARLTMGGEPTFVSIDNMQAEEWNTSADGPHKRERAGDLFVRLREAFSSGGGLLHYGQGKWYPGEILPRWQLGLYWRKDGVAIWKNKDLVAQDTVKYKYTYSDAEKFGETLVQILELSPQCLVPGYEDVFYYLWKEGTISTTSDPLKADLKDSAERQKLAEVLNYGLEKPVGIALPLKWDYYSLGWKSRIWKFRRNNMFLLPGNSPMGFRLPLNSLEEIDAEKTDVRFPRDPFSAVDQLPKFDQLIFQHADKKSTPEKLIDTNGKESEKDHGSYYEDDDFFRTALCIEPREGRIHIFLPPLDLIEHYLELISAIETTAAKLQIPVRIEGYTPPYDQRIQQLVISPDPGVI